MSFNAKECRHIAQRLLQLADALDEGKVHVVGDSPYIEHDFYQRFSGRLMDIASGRIPDEPIKAIRCKHDLEAFAFHLVGVYCEISKQFMINETRSKMLVEQMHYLTP